MSRTIFDFLLDSPLLHEEAIAGQYQELSEGRLLGELQRYRDYVLGRLGEIGEEMTAAVEGPKAFVGGATTPNVGLGQLKRMLLYFDRVVVDDPLFPLTRRKSNEAYAKFLGYKGGNPVDRETIAQACAKLRSLQPLVAHDFVRIAPISLANEPPPELPLLYSPTLFAELVPENLLAWFKQRARIMPLERVEGGWGAPRDMPLRPCRAIAIEFKDFPRPMIFHLMQTQAERDPENPNHFYMTQWLPDEPPTEDQFRIWITQSVNKYAGNVFKSIATDVGNATACNAMLLTDSEMVSDFLALSLPNGRTIESDIARLTLKLELPTVDSANAEDLIRIRNDHGRSFEAFRLHLERGLRAVRSENDTLAQRRQLDELRHELEDTKVREMRQTLAELKRGLLRDAVFGAVSLIAAVPAGGDLSLLAALMALSKGLKRLDEFDRQAKTHPAYFVWKLRHSQK